MIRKIVSFVTSIIIILTLFACNTLQSKPAQDQVDQANIICTNQVKRDQANRTPKWFTDWLRCRQEYVMPLEIRIYPDKEAQIRTMYDNLLVMGISVDAGLSKVEPVYDEWNRMQAEIGMNKGLCFKNKDGSQQCFNHKPGIVYVRDKNGHVVPIKAKK